MEYEDVLAALAKQSDGRLLNAGVQEARGDHVIVMRRLFSSGFHVAFEVGDWEKQGK